MIAATDKTIHGTGWQGWQEELTFASPEALRGIATDDKQMVAVGTLESVMVKRASAAKAGSGAACHRRSEAEVCGWLR